MVRIIALIVMYLVSQLIGAQTTNNSDKNFEKEVKENMTITVTVPNIPSDSGTVRFALYTKDSFLQQPITAEIGKIKEGYSVILFKNVMAGEYAVVCFHDSNSNEKLDFEDNGIPKESFGTSNNVLLMGPPNFEDAKFIVTNKSLDLTIKF